MRYANKKSFISKVFSFFGFFVFGLAYYLPYYPTAFAQSPQTECPPECVTDSMEIETYYPSPYGYYEELRGDKIIVGDTDNSRIDETHLPPSGTLTFEPKSYAEITNTGTSYEGAIYYDSFDHEFKYYDNNSSWQPLVGGGDYWTDSGSNIYNVNSGNVGIGTATPQYKFTVEGAIASSEGTIIYNCSGTLSLSYSSSCTIAGRLINTQTLMGSAHTPKQCTDGGGTITTAGGQQVCKFGGSACPGGWAKYSNWSTTSATTCVTQNNPCGCPNNSCTTGSHSVLSDTGPETCSFISNFTAGLGWCNGCGWYTCTAAITAVACY